MKEHALYQRTLPHAPFGLEVQDGVVPPRRADPEFGIGAPPQGPALDAVGRQSAQAPDKAVKQDGARTDIREYVANLSHDVNVAVRYPTTKKQRHTSAKGRDQDWEFARSDPSAEGPAIYGYVCRHRDCLPGDRYGCWLPAEAAVLAEGSEEESS
jgi:hypothetical protein